MQYQPQSCDYFVDNSSTGCSVAIGGTGSPCSDSNLGTDLAHAWFNATKISSQSLAPGKTACLVGQANPNTNNGGIWRGQQISVSGSGTGWGPGKQITVTSMDPSIPAYMTGASCYAKAAGLCTGSAPVVWHQCAATPTTGDALCHGLTTTAAPNINNVYEYTRPLVPLGGIYVDDPDVIYGRQLWTDQTKFLNGASCLPGQTCTPNLSTGPYGNCSSGHSPATRGCNMYQSAMTAGTWYDDCSDSSPPTTCHLYLWMADNSDPSTHILEVPTGPPMVFSTDGLVYISGTTHDYVMVSNIVMPYFPANGVLMLEGSATAPLHVWADHIYSGGFGFGPVTNEGLMYSAGILFRMGSMSAATDTNGSASETHITNSVANWCGSHNCLGTDFVIAGGTQDVSGNVAGPAEHNQFDTKCAGGVSMYRNNIAHDAWMGTIIGSDSVKQAQGNAYYSEISQNICTGGTLTWQNDIAIGSPNGIYCNNPSIVTVPVTRTCNMYNNTIIKAPGNLLFTACLFYSNGTSSTMIGDAENNICVSNNNTSNDEGWAWSAGGAVNTPVEQYNLYYNTTGTTNNRWGNTNYNTLASWQANCGGGAGICGTPDWFQVNPMGSPDASIALAPASPAVGVGNPAVGTGSVNLGAAPVAAVTR
jgi:hypothetical protein